MTAQPAGHGPGRFRPDPAEVRAVVHASAHPSVHSAHHSAAATDRREPAIVRPGPGYTVVELHGDQDVLTADALREALTEACGRRGHVLIDLSDVRLIDSTALGLLVRAHQDAKRHGRFVCLVAPSRFVITVLHTMRLRGVFPDFPDLGQTREWLAALP